MTFCCYFRSLNGQRVTLTVVDMSNESLFFSFLLLFFFFSLSPLLSPASRDPLPDQVETLRQDS